MHGRSQLFPFFLALGLGVLGLAALSVVDMFLPRPYDGIVLDADVGDSLLVREVVRGSGAHRAGIRPGDQVVGIAREVLRDTDHAARALNRFRIGAEVPYLVTGPRGLREVKVELGRRSIGDGTYFYTSALGFSFFFIGLFVLVRRSTLAAGQLFFLLCCLFTLFLVCRLRPASYSGVDEVVLGIGTVAFLLLPPAFLHFYLIFPRPAWVGSLVEGPRAASIRRWRPAGLALLAVLYLLPGLVFGLTFAVAAWRDSGRPALIGGAPAASWWLLAAYVSLGLAALGANARRIEEPSERRGTLLVLAGSLFGLVPFLVSCALFPALQHTRAFFLFGIMPLVLVPLTFTWAIVHFQLLDIRVILRRSLLYTVTTALVTGLYAGAIAAFDHFFRGSRLAGTGFFPIVLALAIVLLFEPLRRRLQEPVDRFFFSGRSRLQRELTELGEAMAGQVDLEVVVGELVERLPQLLQLRFAALYLLRKDTLVRRAGPASLPAELPASPELLRRMDRREGLVRLDRVARLSGVGVETLARLAAAGVEKLAGLATRRRSIGLVLLSERQGRLALEREDLELLDRLLEQAALALETSLLLEERTHQAELQRELEIAASIQLGLLPERLGFADGWRVSAVCRPARDVGGDFYAQLPRINGSAPQVVFADVSGKSVSGALMMMASHEVLHALAMTHPEPSTLFALANRRLYALGKRSFVALGLLTVSADGRALRYLLAGQPPPLLRRQSGEVVELPMGDHRLPLGALPEGDYRPLEVPVEAGELVLAYSDGVTDALSPDGEPFGCERLCAVIAGSRGDPETVAGEVLAAVDIFTQGAQPYDDLTLVVVARSE